MLHSHQSAERYCQRCLCRRAKGARHNASLTIQLVCADARGGHERTQLRWLCHPALASDRYLPLGSGVSLFTRCGLCNGNDNQRGRLCALLAAGGNQASLQPFTTGPALHCLTLLAVLRARSAPRVGQCLCVHWSTVQVVHWLSNILHVPQCGRDEPALLPGCETTVARS